MRFNDVGTEDIANKLNTKRARKTLPQHLHKSAFDLLGRLAMADKPSDMRTPPSNRFETYTNPAGVYSVRINNQYRILFRWEGDEAVGVEIKDFHG